MKRIIFATIAALTLSACATTPCAVENPDGTCACKVVDENGNCVEGGGPGGIIPN